MSSSISALPVCSRQSAPDSLVIDTPTYFSYGFTTAKAYAGVLMEPYAPRADSHFTSYSINPPLPAGVTLSATTGIISGTPATTSPVTQYTVTASNTMGSLSTTFSMEFVDQNTMTLGGLTGIYYATLASMHHPTLDFFRNNNGQISLRHTSIDFDDEWQSSHGGHVVPGLDDRFRDFWSAYYIGYFIASVSGDYTFQVNSDDGACVYVDNMETAVVCSKAAGGGTYDGPVTLTAGKHLIYITWFDINYGTRIHVYFKNDAAGISYTLLSEANTRIGGRAPTFLTYDVVTGIAGYPIHNVLPNAASGYAQSYSVNPALPPGITIDPTTGVISGYTPSPITGEYTVTMSGVTGTCEAKVKVVIIQTPAPGALAKWYRIQEYNDVGSYKYFTDYLIDPRVFRIEGQINYPDSNGDGVMSPGLSPDMYERIYTTWTGYLYFDEIGDWELAGNADDGIRLYFNNEFFFEQWRIGGIEAMVSKVVSIPKVGYYPFSIQYFEQAYGNGILFKWRRPALNTFDVIPTSFFFHAPPTPLTYTQQQYIVYQNQPAVSNAPIWTGATASGTYTVSPALPDGLTINSSTGVISGTATSVSSIHSYTVTCGSYSTVIKITVMYCEPVANFHYKFNGVDITVNDVQTLTIGQYFHMQPIYTGRADTWSCSPEPPRGIYIESYSGWFKGTPAEALNTNTVYTLTGCNQGGCASTQVTIKVPGCNDNDRYWYTQIVSGSGNIIIKSGATQLDSQNGGTGAYRHCLSATGSLTHRFECTSTSGCSIAYYRDDLTYLFTQTTVGGSAASPATVETTFTNYIGVPTMSLSANSITTYRLQNIDPIKFTINNGYKTVTFTPALPSTVTFNYEKSQLEGYFPTVGTFTYSIVASNPVGQTNTASLTVNVISCGNNKALIRVLRKSAGWNYQETFTITQNSQTLLSVEARNDNEKRYFAICVDYAAFELNLYDMYNDGWAPDSYVALSEENGSLIGKYTHNTDQNVQTFTINMAYTIKMEDTWKVSTTYFPGWNTESFSDATWQSATRGTYPNYVGNTIYLRHTISIDDITLYPLLDISPYFTDGCVVYANGVEVYRKNMPTGVISDTTLANNKYDAFLYRRSSIPAFDLKTGTNIIAVEIHKYSTTVSSTKFDFDLYARLIQGSCINRIDGVTLSNSGAYNMPFETVNEAFDDDVNTKWLEDGLPAYAQVSFNYERQDFINKIQIWSANDFSERDPRHFIVKATNDQITWDTLLEVDQLNIWSERHQMREWYLTTSTKSYNTFRIEIKSTTGGVSRAQVSEIKLFACQITYCMPDGAWPSVQSGNSVTIDCPSDSFGLQTRFCSDATTNPTWIRLDQSNCLSNTPASGSAYVDSVLNIKGATIEAMTSSGETIFKNVVSTVTGLSVANIHTFLFTDASTASVSAVTFYMRLTTSTSNSDALSTLLLSSLSTITTSLKTYKEVFSDTTELSFVKTPVINKNVGLSGGIIALIVVLAILAIIAVVFIVACVFFRTKKSTKHGAKKLQDKKKPTANHPKKEAVRV